LQLICNRKKNYFVSLQLLSARRAVMSSEDDGAAGRSTTLWKGVTDALFLDFETSTIEYRTRTLQMWLHGV